MTLKFTKKGTNKLLVPFSILLQSNFVRGINADDYLFLLGLLHIQKFANLNVANLFVTLV